MRQFELNQLPVHGAGHPGVPVHGRLDDARTAVVALGRARHRLRLGDDPPPRDADAADGRRPGRPGRADRQPPALVGNRLLGHLTVARDYGGVRPVILGLMALAEAVFWTIVGRHEAPRAETTVLGDFNPPVAREPVRSLPPPS